MADADVQPEVSPGRNGSQLDPAQGASGPSAKDHPTLLLPASAPVSSATVVAGRVATPVPADQVGTERLKDQHRLGPYTLLRIIGHGGMGAVWEAVDHRLGRHVALKVRTGNATPEAEERFRREAHHSARLRHANIVAVHDFGSDGGRQDLVMDLLQGDTLTETLRTGRLTYRDKVAILIKICRAVQYAHEQGLIHRDLKPSNIILEASRRGSTIGTTQTAIATTDVAPDASTPWGEPLVMDFGLAKDTTNDSSLSQSGQAMGTPSYMPPEQAEGRLDMVGPGSDVYSLGAILYEMLTGRPPFTGENVMQVLRAVSFDDPIAPRQISPDVARDLETICLTCLAKQPVRRYQTAALLADDLSAWLAGDHIRARPPTWMQRSARLIRRHASMVATIALAVVILAGTTLGFMWSLREKRDAALRAEAAALQAEGQARAALAASAVAHAAERAADAKRHDEEERRLALEHQRELDRVRAWNLVFSDDFSDPAVSAQNWVSAAGEALPIRHGMLEAGGNFVLSLRKPMSGDIRIEWDCTFTSADIDDLSCFMDAALGQFGSGRVDTNSGYEFKSGAYHNTRNMLKRRGVAIYNQVFPGLVPDHAYHARAERIGDRLRYTVDDVLIFDITDSAPIHTSGREMFIGLTSWRGHEQWRNVRISTLGAPRTADLLEFARDELNRGHAQAAIDLFQEVIDSASDDERRTSAKEGLRLAESLRHVEDYRQAIARAFPGIAIRVSDLSDGTLEVAAAGLKLSDVSALRGMPISVLNLRGNRLTDVSPLAGMPLRSLDIGDNAHISPLSLKGISTRKLNIDGDGISDLTPLRGIPLEELSCGGDGITSLEPLRGMPLKTFGAQGNRLTSLEPLRGMALTVLYLQRNDLTDLSPLNGSPVTYIDVSSNRIATLDGLHGMALTELHITDNKVASLAGLQGMTSLKYLQADGNAITDLAPLRELKLVTLNLDFNAVESLAALHGMPLQVLQVTGNRIASLAPVQGCPLQVLWCGGNPLQDLANVVPALPRLRGLECGGLGLTDLSFLAHLPLLDLRCSRNPITSLEPLRGMPLDLLYCTDTKVSSLEPLAHLPISRVFLMGDPITSIAPLLGISQLAGLIPLTGIPDHELVQAQAAWSLTSPALAQAILVERARRSGEGEQLAGATTAIAGHRFLVVAQGLTAHESRQLAQRLGAHLAVITSQDLDTALQPLFMNTPLQLAWIGGTRTRTGVVWDDGTPASFDNTVAADSDASGDLLYTPLGWHALAPSWSDHYALCLLEWDR